ECPACRLRRHDRAVGSGLLQQLSVVVFGSDVALKQNMRVCVDQTGKAGRSAEIDGVSRNRGSLADGGNFVIRDRDGNVATELVRFAVEESSAAKSGDCLWCLSKGEAGQKENYCKLQSIHGRRVLPQQILTTKDTKLDDRPLAAIKRVGVP